jgi:hypothetical protein
MLTEQTRTPVTSQPRQATGTIDFEQGGRFSARDVPVGILGTQRTQQPHVFSGAGTWKLVSKGGSQEVELLFQEMQNSVSLRTPYGTRLIIGERGTSIVLFFFDGDPDEGRKVEFQRHR